jgi:hypothetical protein
MMLALSEIVWTPYHVFTVVGCSGLAFICAGIGFYNLGRYEGLKEGLEYDNDDEDDPSE